MFTRAITLGTKNASKLCCPIGHRSSIKDERNASAGFFSTQSRLYATQASMKRCIMPVSIDGKNKGLINASLVYKGRKVGREAESQLRNVQAKANQKSDEVIKFHSVDKKATTEMIQSFRKEFEGFDWLEPSLLDDETVLQAFRSLGTIGLVREFLLQRYKYFGDGKTIQQTQTKFVKQVADEASRFYLVQSKLARSIFDMPKDAVDQFIAHAAMETPLEMSFSICGRTIKEWCGLGAVVLSPHASSCNKFTIQVPPLWFQNYLPQTGHQILHCVGSYVAYERTNSGLLTWGLGLRVNALRLLKQTTVPLDKLFQGVEGPDSLLHRSVTLPVDVHTGAIFYGWIGWKSLNEPFTLEMPVEYGALNSIVKIHGRKKTLLYTGVKFILLKDAHRPKHSVALFIKHFNGTTSYKDVNKSYSEMLQLWEKTMSAFSVTAREYGKEVGTSEVVLIAVSDSFETDTRALVGSQTLLLETRKLESLFGGFGPYLKLYDME